MEFYIEIQLSIHPRKGDLYTVDPPLECPTQEYQQHPS